MSTRAALIFDFDGVIVLSETARFKVLQSLSNDAGYVFGDGYIEHLAGRTTRIFLTEYVGVADLNDLNQIIARYERIYKDHIIDHIKPVALTVDFIRDYAGGMKLSLVSMSDKKIIGSVLEHYAIKDKFRVIISKDDVARHKPDPEAYVSCSERLGIAPQDCIVIEDTPIGVTAALAAGMRCFVILNGENRRDAFTHLAIEGFIETKQDLRYISG